MLLFSLDGVRPDALQAAETPHIDRLRTQGAWTWAARSVMPSITLPCHLSMLRGVPVERHGITSNNFQPLARPVPSVIDAAHAAGKRTAFFYNWEPLRDVTSPGSLDIAYYWGDHLSAAGDRAVAEQAAAHLSRDHYDLVFVYLGWTDECGHRHGWMSEPYLQAIADADACVGAVLQAAGGPERTVTLVLSDHGGHGRSHGTECDEDMTVPWILSGPGVAKGRQVDAPIVLWDTCTTLAHLLGLPQDPEWDGRVVREALE